VAESASSARHFQVLIVGGGFRRLIVAAQLLRARPAWNLGHPGARSRNTEYQSRLDPAGAGLLAARADPPFRGQRDPAGAVLIQGKRRKFLKPPRPRRLSRPPAKPLKLRRAGGGQWVLQAQLESDHKGCRRHSAATASSATTHAPHRDHLEAIRSFKGGTAVFSATLPPPIKNAARAPQKVMYLDS